MLLRRFSFRFFRLIFRCFFRDRCDLAGFSVNLDLGNVFRVRLRDIE